MVTQQLNLDLRSKEAESIARLRQYEPPEGYSVAVSFGKDSTLLYHLVVLSGVKHDAHYSQTGIDPPELVRFGREHFPDVVWDKPKEHLWSLIEQKGLPIRRRRYCCDYLKERQGIGRVRVMGIRSQESRRRAKRPLYQLLPPLHKSDPDSYALYPIIDWTEAEVWDYIKSNGLPYCSLYDEGFKRLGCVLCPLTSPDQAQREADRWPKIADAWRRAANRFFLSHPKAHKGWPSGDAYFDWWMSRKPFPKKSPQLSLEM